MTRALALAPSTQRGRISTLEQHAAVFSYPGLYALAAIIPTTRLRGRPPAQSPFVLLAMAALGRRYGSMARVEAEFRDELLWTRARRMAEEGRAAYAPHLPPVTEEPPRWDHWRWLRDHHLTSDEALAELQRIFIESSVATARDLGQLDPRGKGSWSHPHPSRAVYGDGTIVRPMYRPPRAVVDVDADGTPCVRFPDPHTGELLTSPPGRHDPDALEYAGQAGPVHGTNYVFFHVRLPGADSRIVLSVHRTPRPGAEAETAVAAFGDVHRVAGDGIQVVVYDGALRGVHIDQLMRRYGVLVINQLPRAPGGGERVYPLGRWGHDVAGGVCSHTLVAVDGALHASDLDEAGDPVLSDPLERIVVKRARRRDGRFHFDACFRVPCVHGAFEVWVSPHAERGDDEARRAENVRILPASLPELASILHVRSDAEGFHAWMKKQLPWQRAMSLGWRRGLLDMHCFGLMHNAVVAYRNR